jgi:hypothetical protein
MEGVGPAKGYGLYHEEIYKLDKIGTSNGFPVYVMKFQGEHPHNKSPLDLSITKNVASLFAGGLRGFVNNTQQRAACFKKLNSRLHSQAKTNALL